VPASFPVGLWCAARPFVKAASERERYNVLGAFHAVGHERVGVTNSTCVAAQTVCELLRRSAASGLGTAITLVMDNARYQRCQRVKDRADSLKIELLFLPSYSPNLNRIERLRKFAKKAALNSRRHASFAKFPCAIDPCLDPRPTTYRSQIATLMTPAFQTFEDVSLLAA